MESDDTDWISWTNAHHYIIDGVPMKVNNNFCPQTFKDSLPSKMRLSQSQSEVLNFKYEFGTENGYIQWYTEYIDDKVERARDKQRKKEEEMLAKQKAAAAANTHKSQSANSKTEKVSKDPQNKPDGSNEGSKKPGDVMLPKVTNSILQPQRASPVSVSSDTSNLYENVNIKDFENIGEDPFDNLELKTLNEAEELKSVFGQALASNEKVNDLNNSPAASSAAQNPDSAVASLSTDVEKLKMNAVYENVEIRSSSCDVQKRSDESRTNIDESHKNCLRLNGHHRDSRPESLVKLKVPLPQPRKSTSQPASPNECATDLQSAADHTEESNYANVPLESDKKPVETAKPKPAVKPKPTVAKGSYSSTGAASKIMSLGNILEKCLNNSNPPSSHLLGGFSYVQLSNKEKDESVKDIEWPSLEQPELSKKSPLPQVTNISADTVKPGNTTSAKTDQLVPSLNITTTTKSSPEVKTASSKPKVARHPPPVRRPKKVNTNVPPSKSSENDDVVTSLVAMGFDRVQINAAMRKYGCDTKKLVDHLVAMGQLSSHGIKWQHAQEALFLFETDTKTAERFVGPYQKLIGIGFESEKVKKALLNCDMDPEKAIEQLLVVNK